MTLFSIAAGSYQVKHGLDMGEGNPLQVAGEILEGSENQAAGQGGMGLIQGIGRKPDYAFLACD
jgi:hypothetical protein